MNSTRAPQMPSISAVIPVYNEELAVGEAVGKVHKFLASLGCDFEVLIVESGSTDRTPEICDALARDLPRVVVVHEGGRNGFGSGLRLGFSRASKDLIWVVPVDLPYPFTALTEALYKVEGNEAILSVRGKDTRSARRQLQSFGYTLLCTALLGMPLRSPNSAFKLYRRQPLLGLPLQSNGWFIDTEIAYRMNERKWQVGLIRVDVIERTVGTSSVTGADSWKLLRQLFAFRKRTIDETRHRPIS